MSWAWSYLACASAVCTRAAISLLLRSVSLLIVEGDALRHHQIIRGAIILDRLFGGDDFRLQLVDLAVEPGRGNARRVVSWREPAPRNTRPAIALAMVAAFCGDSELTAISTRKVVPCRVTFIRL